MADRSEVTQVVQLGVETTAGTLVAATQKLQTLDFAIKSESTADEFRPSGFKYNTIVQETKEWASAAVKGAFSYGEMLYLFAGALNSPPANPTTTFVADGAKTQGAFVWNFLPSTTVPDTPYTYTIEQGSSFRAHRFGFGMITELGLSLTREKVDVNATVMAQRLNDGFTLTPSLPSPELIPATANQWSIYLDALVANLGVTQLLRAFAVDWKLSNRFGPVWPIDASQASYAAYVEIVPKLELTLTLEADTQGMGLLPIFRAGTTQFVRLRATGPAGGTKTVTANTNGTTALSAVSPVLTAADVGRTITGPGMTTQTIAAQAGATGTLSAAAGTTQTGGTFVIGGVPYTSTIDMAVKVQKINGFKDDQGIFAIEFILDGVHDAGWGKAMTAQVVNQTTAM